MKNLPENNFWNEVGNRLGHYAEEPADDSWDKIAGGLRNKPQPRIIAWLERRASSAQASLTGFTLLVALLASDQPTATWSNGIAHAKNVATVTSTAPAEARTIASLANASAQEHKPSSHTAVKQERSTTRSDQHVRNTSQKASRKGMNTHGKVAQPEIVVHTDPGKVTSEEKFLITRPEEQDTTSFSDQAPANKQAESSAVTSAVDTIVQKDVDKKKKALVVTTKEKRETEKKRVQLHIPMIYFQTGTSLGYTKITPSTNDDVTITDLEESGVFASDRVGFSVEAGFQYRILPRLEVYGGLSYYQQNQHIRYTLALAKPGGVTGSAGEGYVFTPVTNTHDVKYAMRNAGVSAGMFYRVKTHLLEHKVGVGLLYQQGFQSASGEGATYTNKGSTYWQYQLLYRMEAGLNDHIRLYFQPGYTHAFRADEKLNEPFTIKPYRAGISVGIVYLFRK